MATSFYTVIVLVLYLTVSVGAFQSGNLVMIAPLSAVFVDAGFPLFANYLLLVAALIAIFTRCSSA